ncbi:Low-density lipoprotein receptor domain class A, partial [Cooperia oncophora]
LCTADEFACIVSEQCIDKRRRCNGITECSDGTDESYCEVCGNGLFHCAKSGECIPDEERCDGKRQCPHGEDEMLCNFAMVFLNAAMDPMRCTARRVWLSPPCKTVTMQYFPVTIFTSLDFSVFSSNPNPSVGPEDYETEYEESATEEDKPSFPMLSMTLPPVIPVASPQTRPPPRVAPAKNTPWASSGAFRKQSPSEPAEPSTPVPTARITSSTTPRPTPKTTQRPTTKATPRTTSAAPSTTQAKPVMTAEKETNRYQTRPVSEIRERVASGASAVVTAQAAGAITEDHDRTIDILQQLGGQLNSRVSP